MDRKTPIDFSNPSEAVLLWNLEFPIDRRWRKRHKVSFGSEQHLKTSFVSMLFEEEEDLLYDSFIPKEESEEEKNHFLKRRGIITTEQFDDFYDKLDLSQFDSVADEYKNNN